MRPLVFAALFAVGCAAAPPTVIATTPPLAELPAEPVAEAPPPPKLAPGVIARCELEQMLATSPGVFLSHVESAPSFHGSRFQGWRISAFFAGDARFAGVDLHDGDVVTRVNGRPIEQPEQFMQVWEGARFRHDLTVELLRNGVPRTLRWTIAD